MVIIMTTAKTSIKYDLKTDVDTLIKQAITSAATMQKKVQIAAVSILQHAHKHGDYTKANDLVNGLGTGVRAAALVEWFSTYGGLTVKEGEEGFSGWAGADHIKDNFQDAKATMWWTLKPVSPFKAFDLEAAIASLVKKAEKAAADTEHAKENNVDAELLAKLRAL